MTKEMIVDSALEAAARAHHEKYRRLRSVEQVPWEQLLPIAKEAAMDDARLIVEAYEQARLADLPADRVKQVARAIEPIIRSGGIIYDLDIDKVARLALAAMPEQVEYVGERNFLHIPTEEDGHD